MARPNPSPDPSATDSSTTAAGLVRTAALVGAGTALTVGAYLETVALLSHFA